MCSLTQLRAPLFSLSPCPRLAGTGEGPCPLAVELSRIFSASSAKPPAVAHHNAFETCHCIERRIRRDSFSCSREQVRYPSVQRSWVHHLTLRPARRVLASQTVTRRRLAARQLLVRLHVPSVRSFSIAE